jgi:hypothetical protein
VCLRVRVSTCWGVSSVGQARFQVRVKELQQGLRQLVEKDVPLGTTLYSISIATISGPGVVKTVPQSGI